MQRKAILVDANHIDSTLEGVVKDNPNEEIEEATEEILQDTLDDFPSNQYTEGATTMLRKPGVEYELKLIEGSGGQLGLVEVRPEQSFFIRWFLAYGNALQHHDLFM
ncbi:hypothetical protein N9Y97_02600 [Pseudomonadales bacterium]|nr:hypothetical protein [Pseudomonadales bacterium]